MNRRTRPDHARAIIARRASAAEQAAAQPKRKRKPRRRSGDDPVPVIAAPPIELRGARELEQLGHALRLNSVVDQRRRELADIASLMTGRPRPR